MALPSLVNLRLSSTDVRVEASSRSDWGPTSACRCPFLYWPVIQVNPLHCSIGPIKSGFSHLHCPMLPLTQNRSRKGKPMQTPVQLHSPTIFCVPNYFCGLSQFTGHTPS